MTIPISQSLITFASTSLDRLCRSKVQKQGLKDVQLLRTLFGCFHKLESFLWGPNKLGVFFCGCPYNSSLLILGFILGPLIFGHPFLGNLELAMLTHSCLNRRPLNHWDQRPSIRVVWASIAVLTSTSNVPRNDTGNHIGPYSTQGLLKSFSLGLAFGPQLKQARAHY